MDSSKLPRAFCAEVIRLLTERRKSLRLSKYALGERSGVSQQMIGYIERGLRNPSLETIFRISEGLDMELEHVLKEARKVVMRAKRREKKVPEFKESEES